MLANHLQQPQQNRSLGAELNRADSRLPPAPVSLSRQLFQ